MTASAAPMTASTPATDLDPTPWVQRHESAGITRYHRDQAEAQLRRTTTGLEVYLAAAPHRLSAALLSAIFCDHPNAAMLRLHGDEPGELHAAGFITRPESQASCPRAGFFQLPWLWHAAGVHPALPPLADDTAHPPRPAQPRGTVYQRHDPVLGAQIAFRVIDPDADLERFHAWMNQPRVAHYWEKAWSEDALHGYLVELAATPHTFGLIALMDGEPFGYFEPYWTLEDRLGPYYDAQPWDRGWHGLVGSRRHLGRARTYAWARALFHYLFLDDPRTQRVVGEPRVDNSKLVNALTPLGCSVDFAFDFPHKRAWLMRCERRRFFAEGGL